MKSLPPLLVNPGRTLHKHLSHSFRAATGNSFSAQTFATLTLGHFTNLIRTSLYALGVVVLIAEIEPVFFLFCFLHHFCFISHLAVVAAPESGRSHHLATRGTFFTLTPLGESGWRFCSVERHAKSSHKAVVPHEFRGRLGFSLILCSIC